MSDPSPYVNSGLVFQSSSLYKDAERKVEIFLNQQILSALKQLAGSPVPSVWAWLYFTIFSGL